MSLSTYNKLWQMNKQAKNGVAKGADGNSITANDIPITDNGDTNVNMISIPKTNRDFLAQYGTAIGMDGKPIIVNSREYVDRFDRGESVKTTATDIPTENNAVDYAALLAKLDEAYEKDEDLAEEDYDKMIDEADELYTGIAEMLKTKYGNMMSMLGDQRSASEQVAAINHNKLLKYLPTQLKSMGLGSLGTSQSAFLKAYNAYNNNLTRAAQEYRKGASDANDTYTSALMSALSNYASNKNSANSIYNNRLDSLRSYYGGKKSAIEEREYQDGVRAENFDNEVKLIERQKKIDDENTLKLKEENDKINAYNAAVETLTFDTFGSAEEVKQYVESQRERVGDNYYLLEERGNKLIKEMQTEKENSLLAYKDTSFKKNVGKDTDYDNDTIKVNYGDKTAKITTGQKVEDAVINRVAEAVAADSAFAYAGKLYFKTKDGRIYTVEEKQGYNKLLNYLYN